MRFATTSHWTAVRAAAMAWLLLSSAAFITIEEEDFVCENTAAHLADCCDDISPSMLYCDYNSCGDPELRTHELKCINSMSCEEIAERDLCTRVLERLANDGTTETRSLCR